MNGWRIKSSVQKLNAKAFKNIVASVKVFATKVAEAFTLPTMQFATA